MFEGFCSVLQCAEFCEPKRIYCSVHAQKTSSPLGSKPSRVLEGCIHGHSYRIATFHDAGVSELYMDGRFVFALPSPKASIPGEAQKWGEKLQVSFRHNNFLMLAVLECFGVRYLFADPLNGEDATLMPLHNDFSSNTVLHEVQRWFLSLSVKDQDAGFGQAFCMGALEERSKELLPRLHGEIPTPQMLQNLAALEDVEGAVIIYENVETSSTQFQKVETKGSTLLNLLRFNRDVDSLGTSSELWKSFAAWIRNTKSDVNLKAWRQFEVASLLRWPEMLHVAHIAVSSGFSVAVVVLGPSAEIIVRELRQGTTRQVHCCTELKDFCSDEKADLHIVHSVATNVKNIEPYRKQCRGNALFFVLDTKETKTQLIPGYLGIFPLALPTEIPLQRTQKTPLHITLSHTGYSSKLWERQKTLKSCMGESVDFNITGFCHNVAGTALLVSVKETTGHITFSTNPGFKPVDVGQKITEEGTTTFDTPMVATGFYFPYF